MGWKMTFRFKRLPLANTNHLSLRERIILKMMNYYLSVKVIFPGSVEYVLSIFVKFRFYVTTDH